MGSPSFVDIAVERFLPAPGRGKPIGSCTTMLSEADRDDDVLPRPGTQRWKASTRLASWTWKTRKPSARNAGKRCRRRMSSRMQRWKSLMCLSPPGQGLRGRPSEAEVGTVFDVVGPWFVFEEFLAHEDHGGAGRREQQASGHAGAAAGIPGAGVAVGQAGNTREAVFQDFVVRFEVLHQFPRLIETGRPERVRDAVMSTGAPAPARPGRGRGGRCRAGRRGNMCRIPRRPRRRISPRTDRRASIRRVAGHPGGRCAGIVKFLEEGQPWL